MDAFSIKWDTETKKLAINCINKEFIELLSKANCGDITSDEEIKIKEISKEINDPYGMWYISGMIFSVEHELADGRDAGARLAAAQIYNVLSGKTYVPEVWQNNTSSEECQNILKLRDSLDELLKL